MNRICGKVVVGVSILVNACQELEYKEKYFFGSWHHIFGLGEGSQSLYVQLFGLLFIISDKEG